MYAARVRYILYNQNDYCITYKHKSSHSRKHRIIFHDKANSNRHSATNQECIYKQVNQWSWLKSPTKESSTENKTYLKIQSIFDIFQK